MDIADYDCDNQVCPTEPLKNTETICDFVLHWEKPNHMICKVIESSDGTFGAYECTNKEDVLVPGNRIDDIPLMNCFDEAQEHLNMYAADHNWIVLTVDIIGKRG